MSDISIPSAPYIPFTIDEMIASLQKLKKESRGDITGEEFVVNAEFLVRGEDNLPPCTLVLDFLKGTLDPEKAEFGSLYITPGKVRNLM